MSETDLPLSRPNDLETAMALLAVTAEALDRAREDVERLKHLLVEQLPCIESPRAAQRFAVEAYWAFPDIPTERLAEMATGLIGRRATFAFTNGIARRDSKVSCAECGAWVKADSRDEMRKLAARGYGKCDDCAPPPVMKAMTVMRGPVSNGQPDALTRELLQAHIRNGAPARVNVVALTGGLDLLMSLDILQRYLRDPDDGAAAALGVSKTDYLNWLESGGSVQCDALTKAGARCRNSLYGGWGEEPADWLKRRAAGALCAVHGGVSRRERLLGV